MRTVAEASLQGVDGPALFADLLAFQKAHGNFGYALGFLEAEAKPALVDGNHATVQVALTEFNFSRVDGRWYLQLLPPTP